MQCIAVACLIVCVLFGEIISAIILENDKISMTFTSNGGLASLLDKSNDVDMASEYSAQQPLCSLHFVNTGGLIVLDVTEAAFVDMFMESNHLTTTLKTQTLWIIYKDIPIQQVEADTADTAWVKLRIDLEDGALLSKWSLHTGITYAPNPNKGSMLGLWEVHINIPVVVGTSTTGELFYPSGLGQGFTNPMASTAGAVEGDYPSGGCSMQFMSIVDEPIAPNTTTSGVYVSAMDGKGFIKYINYGTVDYRRKFKTLTTHTYRTSSSIGSGSRRNPLQKEAWVASEHGHVASTAASNEFKVHVLSVVAVPENAGVPIERVISTDAEEEAYFILPYEIAVGIVQDISAKEGKPLWFQASQIYRQWALENATWTLDGTLRERDEKEKEDHSNSRTLPEWYRENSIWINSHWQCLDIFNNTGGDPAWVSQYAKKIATLLAQPSLAFHWYEWQQGPDPKPDKRYLFDTHYPDYFPPRVGFKQAIQELKDEANIHTFPYINGRIFDIASDSYVTDNGEQYCTKDLLNGPSLVTSSTKLQTIIETYGSNATFCVANPSEPYWQAKIVDTTVDLIDTWGSAGVYIDQIGASKPSLCWDSTMNHSLGGGMYWTNGYTKMLNQIKKNNPRVPIVTECNAEPYMSNLDGYLVLTTFKGDMSQSPRSLVSQSTTSLQEQGQEQGQEHNPSFPKSWNPSFAAVYGGYYIAMGAEWSQSDFLDHDWWRGKLAATFQAGTQLGWFSLAGLDNGQDKCGPMGVGENLLDLENRNLVQFLQTLAAYRRVGIDYFVDGHMASPVLMSPPIQVHTQNAAATTTSKKTFDAVSMVCWHLDHTHTHTHSTLAVFTGNTLNGYTGKMRIDFAQWGYDSHSHSNVNLRVEQLLTHANNYTSNGKQRMQRVDRGIVSGPIAWLSIEIHGTDVVMLEFTPVSSEMR